MRIGEQEIQGIFEYIDSVEFTEGDIVIATGENNIGEPIRKIFFVKTDVIGVNPLDDAREVYYEDYFIRSYGGKDGILTTSTLMDKLRSVFVGIGENGLFTPEIISPSKVSSIRTSGVWKVGDTDRTVVVFMGVDKGYMLSTSPELALLRFGDKSTGEFRWGPYINITTSLDGTHSWNYYINKLLSLEVLLRHKIDEVDDLKEAILGSFTTVFDVPFNTEDQIFTEP